MDLNATLSAGAPVSETPSWTAQNEMPVQTVTPVFIGNFIRQDGQSGPSLTRIADWQAFNQHFKGAECRDLMQAEFQEFAMMVSAKKDGQDVNFVMNPYTLFIQQAIMNWQDGSLALCYGEDEIMGMAERSTFPLPANAGFLSELMEQVGTPALTSYHAVRHYFTQGGNACYVLSVDDPTQADCAALAEMIIHQPEIDLCCSLLSAEFNPVLQLALPVQAPLFTAETFPYERAAWYQGEEEITLFTPNDAANVTLMILPEGEGEPRILSLAELQAEQPLLAERVRTRLATVSLPVVLPMPAALLGRYCQLANALGSRASADMEKIALAGSPRLFDVQGLPLHRGNARIVEAPLLVDATCHWVA